MPGKLLAIDPSLTASGWALFDIDSGIPLLFDIICPPGPKTGLSERYSWLQTEVVGLLDRLDLGEADYLVCEGPAPLVKNPESALRVERVRGVFEAVGRMRSICVISRLNPRTVQSELLGLTGKQLKREIVKQVAREVAEKLFPSQTAKTEKRTLSQDVVDALLIGALAVTRVQLHQKSGVELEALFQPKKRGRGSGRERFAGWRVSNG